MKKIIIVLIFLVGQVFAQDILISTKNSSTTALDSAGVFTGTVDEAVGYNYLTIIAKSDKASASSGIKIQFGRSSGTYEHNYFFSYTAGDTLTNKITLPIAGRFFRVVYTNTTSAQTTFSLTTYKHKEIQLPIDATGSVKVAVTSSALPTGAATSAKQDSGEVTLNNIEGSLLILRGYEHPATKYLIVSGSVDTTDVDTVSFTSTVWTKFKLEALDSTIELSFDGFVTALDVTTLTPFELLDKISAVTFPEIYVRKKLNVGTATYKITWYGY